VRRLLLIVIPVLLVLAAGGVAAWWFLLRDDPLPPASLPDPTTTVAETTVPTTAPPVADGVWAVQQREGVYAGYRVQEVVVKEALERTAVGRTPAVAGALTIEGPRITTASIDVDLTKLVSDQPERDEQMRTRGLETDQFPTATFRLTLPIDLPGPPVVGTVVKAQAVGDLTLHGVTKPVTVTIDARWNGDSIDIAGSTPIVLADFAIEPPSIAGLVDVADTGVLEFVLALTRAP
jgi:polyisoprenoid-binding protein YceI